jgi:hypothetical protein
MTPLLITSKTFWEGHGQNILISLFLVRFFLGGRLNLKSQALIIKLVMMRFRRFFSHLRIIRLLV